MADLSPVLLAAADRALAAVAEQIVAEADEVAAVLVDTLLAEVPEVSVDPLSTEETRRSVRAALVALVGAWRRGAPLEQVAAPPEVLFQVGVMARDGIPLDALLRICQLSHGRFADEWDARLAGAGLTAEVLAAAMRRGHQLTFAWFNGLTAALTAAYAAERERVARTPERVRREAVEAALSGRTVDVDALSRTAGYEFRRRHLGLVLWLGTPLAEGVPAVPGDPQPVLAAVARSVADALDAPPPLVVAAASGVAWGWVALRAEVDEARVRAVVAGARPEGMSIAVGDVALGLPGFRSTHDDALAAARVAMRGAVEGVVAFGDVELVALMAGDVVRARRFVRRQLGPLAVQGDREAERLRATLAVWFAEQGNRRTSAARLGVHPNTVSNRVRTCEELLGRSLGERAVELQVALVLRERLGAEVA